MEVGRKVDRFTPQKTEATVGRSFSKQVFLGISQYSQENNYVGVSFW